jgi:molybdenum cofactor cytidylyltransferase
VRFGRVAVRDAVGAVSAHTIRAGEAVVRKGRVVGEEDAERLARAGIETLVAARLEPGDVGEDAAAARLAAALAGDNLTVEKAFTGRANLFAARPGILVVDEAAIRAVNGVDEAVTAATLPAYRPVVAGEMAATVKIIPYAVPGAVLERAVAEAGRGLRVAPYRRLRVAVLSTLLPGLKPSVIEKTLDVLAGRLRPAGAEIVHEARVAHEAGALAAALPEAAGKADLVVVFGASAIADRADVIPAAIEAAGGRVEHLGMPVDPGNLLLVGALGAVPVVGAPGCARSPKENGFDWVLQRLLADLPVTRADIVALGVGGLLMEIVSRPQPRSGEEPGGEEPADDDAASG